MKVEFRKVLAKSSPFFIKKGDIECEGTFKRLSSKEVEVELTLKGSLLHPCDGCLKEFDLKVEQTSKLIINDGVYNGDDLDVVESFDGFIDFDEVCQSEIESIKSDYHYCKSCENNFKE